MTAKASRKFRTAVKDLTARALTLEACTDEVTDRFMESQGWESTIEKDIRIHMDQASTHMAKARLEMNTVLVLVARKTPT